MAKSEPTPILPPKRRLTLLPELKRKVRYIRDNVLGMNLRNSEFIFKHNPLKLFRLVDNKILTKEALIRHGIQTPKMYFAVKSYFEVKRLHERFLRHETSVMKPANGFGGEGVVIVNKVSADGYEVSGMGTMTVKQMDDHARDILSGIYSLTQMPDHALCEEKLEPDPAIASLTYKGIPDIRVVLFRGVPVMAMLRLSTLKSKGKANLHQGGIGVGVDLATGHTLHAIQSGQYLTHHPDNGTPLIGVSLPHWQSVVDLATRCYDAAPLGYLGVDIVLDPRRGPMVLELNARPGLMIQMANRMGLKPILMTLRKEPLKDLSHAEKTALGQSLYAKFRALG